MENPATLLIPGGLKDVDVQRALDGVGFADWQTARKRLCQIAGDPVSRDALAGCLPMLLQALSEAASADLSLINFQRFVDRVDDRLQLFQFLTNQPRAVEILIRLFVGSQFLTEILLRNPNYLEHLTHHKRLAEFKSREQFLVEARQACDSTHAWPEQLDALRRMQKWEFLRIGACDTFGLMDLKSVTVQLSLLTDSLVQLLLEFLAEQLQVSRQGFAILAMGKLGGEELNYSSDIDLVFLADAHASRFWPLGQRLIQCLMETTAEGFLYRVDMRLRPWGTSGALVNTVEAHVDYLQNQGELWELQALVKARPIAGDPVVGRRFVQQVHPLLENAPIQRVQENIRRMKKTIEARLDRRGRKWAEVKSGPGSIRDIEFLTQYLQLAHWGDVPQVRSINTLDALMRLVDCGLIQSREYRVLSDGYVFLRTVEHALQLKHHRQTHTLPMDPRELAYLARRLDYPDADTFVSHLERHRESIRSVFSKYINGQHAASQTATQPTDLSPADHRRQLGPSYAQAFTAQEFAEHGRLLGTLNEEQLVQVEAVPLATNRWQLTIVGRHAHGDLTLICGLLLVYGFDIVQGQAFTAVGGSADDASAIDAVHDAAVGPGRFVNVLTVRSLQHPHPAEVWQRYEADLRDLKRSLDTDGHQETQGQLAQRVAAALSPPPNSRPTLYPVDIEIDNSLASDCSVLRIHAHDTTGFLYELCSALALSGINIARLAVSSSGHRVFDTLHVTDQTGAKITDPEQQSELRAAVVLIKHFTHLLPRSPNPERALIRFPDFLQHVFSHGNWVDDLADLEQSDVLNALAHLLGVSDFLWEDFLRLQHANLFPVVTDIASMQRRKLSEELQSELQQTLAECCDYDHQRSALNAFKDREMFRTDMRHITGQVEEFGEFSDELTDLADVIVAGAYRICRERLAGKYGTPRIANGKECPLAICALGKCGGRELGFASDIELMFIFAGEGRTDQPHSIRNEEYFRRMIELFTQTIEARRAGIFQIDLRLRPYGQSGPLAVSLAAFENYFTDTGAAWPYERQALVKLRPVAGNPELQREISLLRDRLIYTESDYDVAAMRGLREKQIRQLVSPGTTNAKLSPGGLVDCEYLVQGLQIRHGQRHPALRSTNTMQAMQALSQGGFLPTDAYHTLRASYIFLRNLIDALRMVRGHARDLEIPAAESDEFEFLARRLGYASDTRSLADDLEQACRSVQELGRVLDTDPD